MSAVDLLKPEAILLNQEYKDSTEVIVSLGKILEEMGHVSNGFINATLEREASMPTGLPLAGEINAAIPHVDISYVKSSALGLATLKSPVIFHHMVDPEQEIPVRLVIMLALDKPKSQIETLQQIANLLQDADLVNQIILASSPVQVLKLLSRPLT